MAQRKHPQVITANRLDDGEVVYFTEARTWTLTLGESLVIGQDDDLDPWLGAAQSDIGRRVVVDVYPFDVAVRGDGGQTPSIEALSAREKIRAKGPTIREDLGKQADGTA